MLSAQTQNSKKLLLASLLLNVFLLGCLLGGTYHLFWSDQALLGTAQRGLRFATEYLPEAEQQHFRSAMRQARYEARPMLKAGIEARRNVRALLQAPSFDRAAVSAEVAKVREADVAVRIKLEQSLIDFAAELSPEERAKLAQGLAKRGPLRDRPLPKWMSQPD
jgi:uncharacterized membrane protein